MTTMVNIVLSVIGIIIAILCFLVAAILIIELADALGYKIPDWIKELKK